MEIPEEKIKTGLLKHTGENTFDDLSIHKVLKLDSNQYYYLLSFTDKVRRIKKVLIMNDGSLEVTQSAEVRDAPIITTPAIVRDLGSSIEAQTQLVWQPSRISFSPYYPFWRVQSGTETFYVDMNNRVYQSIPTGKGG